ncbi:MAG: hypothetical protein ABGW69_02895 [Nanoarchaeota archaeon]
MNDKKLKIILAYLLGWITGLIMLLVEKEDNEVRKHAAQSLIIFGLISLISIVLETLNFFLPFFFLLNYIIQMLGLILWIYLIVKALIGESVIFDFLEPYINKLTKMI